MRRVSAGRETMTTRKVWEPFGSVFCPEIKNIVDGEIQVLVHIDTAEKERPTVPTGKMECSGAGECGVEPADCPIFKAFKT
jgi:hypothetical protein